MPRRFVHDVDLTVPAEVIYRDFTNLDYWEGLVDFYRENSTTTEIAHFSSDENGTDISFAHKLSSADLPAAARSVVKGMFVVTRIQHFDPFDHITNQALGRYEADVPTVPVEISGEYVLAETATGSRMRLQASCGVRVPIIGGGIETLLVSGLRTLFSKEGEFTADWIASHH